MLSPTFSVAQSPAGSLYSPITPQSAMSEGQFKSIGESENARNPFNFTTQQYTAGRAGAARSVSKQPVQGYGKTLTGEGYGKAPRPQVQA